MAITDRIPLAKAGRTKRNIVVAVLYLVFLPFVIAVIPFYLLYAVGTNRNGLGDAVADSPLGAIPGVGSGGWSAAIVVFVGVIIVFGALGAVLPETDSGSANTDPETSGDTDDLEEASDNSADEDENSDDGNTDASSGESDNSGSDTNDDSTGEPQLTELQSIRTVDDRHDPYSRTFEGSGQTVTDEFSAGGQAGVFIFEHDGETNFIVELINAETGETEEILVNEIGSTDGAVAVPMMPEDYYLDVTADGPWSIEFAEPLPMEEDIHQLPVEGSGEEKDVIGPVEIDGRVTVAGEHNGESNFIVQMVDELAMYPADQVVVFNEIGQFEGETSVRYDGVVWIVVDADGEWSVEIE